MFRIMRLGQLSKPITILFCETPLSISLPIWKSLFTYTLQQQHVHTHTKTEASTERTAHTPTQSQKCAQKTTHIIESTARWYAIADQCITRQLAAVRDKEREREREREREKERRQSTVRTSLFTSERLPAQESHCRIAARFDILLSVQARNLQANKKTLNVTVMAGVSNNKTGTVARPDHCLFL